MMQRRLSKHSPIFLEGHVVFADRSSSMECTVRDVSETGARIMFDQPVPIPPEFELDIPKRRLSRSARIVWSDGRTHGVEFIQEPNERRASDVLRKKPALPAAPDAMASSIRDILDDTRGRIARLVGVTVDAVSLKLDIGE